jgi:hypothetical protein
LYLLVPNSFLEEISPIQTRSDIDVIPHSVYDLSFLVWQRPSIHNLVISISRLLPLYFFVRKRPSIDYLIIGIGRLSTLALLAGERPSVNNLVIGIGIGGLGSL